MITASLVTYKTDSNDLENIIKSVVNSKIDTLYLIDNSTDNYTREFVKNINRIEYIPSRNVGYGRAHNIGIRKAQDRGSKYHLILNPDIIFNPEVIMALENFMNQNDDTGLVMPLITYPDGSTQYVCKLLPTPKDLFLRRFTFDFLFRKIKDKYELHHSGYDKIMDVPNLSGCFMFARTSVLKEVGGFDERFFMYGEDIDLTRRIHNLYRTVFFPAVSVMHAHKKASYKYNRMLGVHIRNLIRYFNKWGWFDDKERTRINQETLKQIESLFKLKTNI